MYNLIYFIMLCSLISTGALNSMKRPADISFFQMFEIIESNSETEEESAEEITMQKTFAPYLLAATISATKNIRKKFTCSYCDKPFAQKYALTRHERIHTGEKPFACSYCNKSFTLKHHLIYHERIHTGEKPFKCATCDKSFTSTTDLSSHVRIHTAKNPFACSYCPSSFIKEGSLTRHINTYHTNNLQ